MEFAFYFLGFGSLLMVLMLIFDTKQHTRLHKMYKDSRDVQPLFMMRATEQKLRTINSRLYGNMAYGTSQNNERFTINEGAKQMVASQLGKLVEDYNQGKINIKVYNNELSEMLHIVEEVRSMGLERIR